MHTGVWTVLFGGYMMNMSISRLKAIFNYMHVSLISRIRNTMKWHFENTSAAFKLLVVLVICRVGQFLPV
jgi:hypothetical protein